MKPPHCSSDRSLRIRLGLLLLSTCFAYSSAQAGPAPVPALPITGTTINGFEVSWDPDPTSDDYFPTDKAIAAALSIDVSGPANPPIGEPNGTHDGHARLGFQDPYFSDTWQVNFYQCTVGGDSCDNGWATNSQIAMPAPKYKGETDDCIRIILGHELFHHVEFSYQDGGGCGGTWGSTVCEGHARAMQDKIWKDADDDPSLTCKAPFLGDVNNYLGNPTQNLWQTSYRGAIWWTYLMEQFGENDEEPTLGADFLVKWWELAGAADPQGDEIGITQDTIHFFAPGRSIGSVFLDFAIANYANTLSFNGAPDGWRERWSYADDTALVSDDFDKPFVFAEAIEPGDPWTFNFFGIDTVALGPWGIHYWEADTSACPTGGVIRLNITHENGQIGRHAAIASGSQIGKDRLEGIWYGTGSSFNIAFVQPSGSNGVDNLTGVVAGTSSASDYQFSFSCYEPGSPANTLQMNPEPFDPTDPKPFLVIPAIVDPPVGPLPLTGIPADQMEIYIGSVALANRAQVLSVAEIGGQNYLRVTPGRLPLSTGEPQDVLLMLKGATKPIVVGRVYNAAGRSSSGVFAADLSNTIDASEIDRMQRAGSLLANALDEPHELGLVRFGLGTAPPNPDAQVAWPVAPLTFAQRLDYEAILGTFEATPSGESSFVDAISVAAQSLVSATGERYVVVATDGRQPPFNMKWDNTKHQPWMQGVRVFTIGIGNDVDAGLLQQIAQDTGGAFYFIPEVDDEVLLAMQGAMADIVERVTRKAPNDVARKEVAVTGTEHRVKLDERSTHHAIVAYYDPAHVSVQLQQANGTPISPTQPGVGVRQGDGVLVAEIDTALYDVELVSLSLQSASTVGGGRGIDAGALITYTGLESPGPVVDLQFAPLHPEADAPNAFVPDGDVGLVATFVDALGPIENAQGQVFSIRAQGGSESAVLFGDGERGSRPPTGGVLTGEYRRTGSYDGDDEPGLPGVTIYVDLNFSGVDNTGHFFSGRKLRAFTVDPTRESSDEDSDDLPDRYEDQHRCLSTDRSDASEDPDGDGLDSATERELGTLPCMDDTDGGGESDGSEVRRGANPFDPADDAVSKLRLPYVDDLPYEHEDSPPQESGTTLHRIPGMRKVGDITLKRGIVASALAPVATFRGSDYPNGYPDRGLENGRTYYYQMVLLGRSGEESAATPIYEGTPYASPFAPLGHVEINDGAPRTDSPRVEIHQEIYNMATDGAQMRLGRTPRLDDVPWQPYQTVIDYTLEPGQRQVYVQFREPMGRVSDVYTDSIVVEEPGRLGGISGRTVSNGKPLAGAGCYLIDEGGVPWAFSDAIGLFDFTLLAPGDYELRCTRDGYEDADVAKVVVVAASTTQVGDLELLPKGDADGDGIPDDEECSYVEGQPPIPDGDANRDGKTDGADYTLWADNFGKTPASFEDGDFNCDDHVDGADYTIWADDFGNTLAQPGGGAAAAASAAPPVPRCGLGAEIGLLLPVVITLRRKRRATGA